MQGRVMRRGWRDPPWALALAVATAVVSPVLGTGQAWILSPIAGVVSLLAGLRMTSLRPALTGFGAGAAGTLMLCAVMRPDTFFSAVLTTLLLTFTVVVLPWWLGRYRRLRVEQTEHERLAITEQARLRERARIAADMHDSLGHELALIAIRSGALELTPRASDQQRAAAAELRASAVAASHRLHEIIGVLQEDAGQAAGRPVHDRPVDESVAGLVRRSRGSGVDVALRTVAAPPGGADWSTTARQAVHRIVQEAITNATKYAPGSTITVRIDERSEPAVIEVGNTAPSARPRPSGAGQGIPPPNGSGQGLTALDERLRLIGGTIEAGPHGDGFVVRARVPRQASAGSADRRRGADGSTTPSHAARFAAPIPALATVKRQSRHRIAQAAALPLTLAVVLTGVLIGAHAMTVQQTALHPDDYASLRIGQTRGEIRSLLPSKSQKRPLPILLVPAVRVDTSCQFYLARANVLDLSEDMYRLCFRDQVLVSKDRLQPKES